jgi:hypothetical protein
MYPWWENWVLSMSLGPVQDELLGFTAEDVWPPRLYPGQAATRQRPHYSTTNLFVSIPTNVSADFVAENTP